MLNSPNQDCQNNTNTQYSISQAVDYIVTEGTSGIWTYRKWNSGIAECWGTYASTAAVTLGAWGSLYAKDSAIPAQALPFTFAEVPKCLATPKLGNSTWASFLYVNLDATTTETPAYGVARANSATGLKPAADLYVIGRWK